MTANALVDGNNVIVDPKVWRRIDNKVKIPKENNSVMVDGIIPVCLGFSEQITKDEIIAVSTDLKQRKFNRKIFLEFEDNQTLQKYQEELGDFWNTIKEDVIYLKDYRKTSSWLEAKEVYLRHFNENEEVYKQAIETDITQFRSRHPEIDIESVRQHIINCAIDILSWMKRSENNNENQMDFNVLLYKKGLTSLMGKLMEDVNKEKVKEYQKNSLIYTRLETKPKKNQVAENSKEVQQNVVLSSTEHKGIKRSLDHIDEPISHHATQNKFIEPGLALVKLVIALGMDAKYVGDVYGTYVLKVLSDPTITNNAPKDDKDRLYSSNVTFFSVPKRRASSHDIHQEPKPRGLAASNS